METVGERSDRLAVLVEEIFEIWYGGRTRHQVRGVGIVVVAVHFLRDAEERRFAGVSRI